MGDFAEVMYELSSKYAGCKRANSDGEEGETHVCALLSWRSEPGDVFVVARRLRDFAQSNNNEREIRAGNRREEYEHDPGDSGYESSKDDRLESRNLLREDTYHHGESDYYERPVININSVSVLGLM